jgi:hypothetical protein
LATSVPNLQLRKRSNALTLTDKKCVKNGKNLYFAK